MTNAASRRSESKLTRLLAAAVALHHIHSFSTSGPQCTSAKREPTGFYGAAQKWLPERNPVCGVASLIYPPLEGLRGPRAADLCQSHT